MYCKNCGEEIDDKAVICVKCGVSISQPKNKNVAFAFIWSFLIAGAGQCYNGEWGKGALMFTGCEILGFFTLCSMLMFNGFFGAFIIGMFVFLVWIGSMIDAVSVAQKINKE